MTRLSLRLLLAVAVGVAATTAAGTAPAQARPHPPPDDRLILVRDPPRPPPPPKKKKPKKEHRPGSHKVGFRFGGGVAPIAHELMPMFGVALAVERQITRRLQWLAEYEHLWLLPRQTLNARMRGESSLDGSGHRANLGLRITLASKQIRFLRLFVDGEAGGGATLAARDDGVHLSPHTFTGIRLGYEFSSQRRETRASKSWEPNLALRMLVVPNGLGFFGGIAMYWGD